MTPAAMRILKELADDPKADLIREGIRAYCGQRPIASRVITELARYAAIRSLGGGYERGATYFTLSDMGRSYLRRPELADEYARAVMDQQGPFTIKDDRIVPLIDP